MTNVVGITPQGNTNRHRPQPARWSGFKEQLKEREWAVPECIPLRNVTLLSGEGGTGKSLLALQLSAAHVLGRDWMTFLPMRGPVIYFTAEEDEDEVHRRMEDIAKFYGVTRRDIWDEGFTLLSCSGDDPVLGEVNRQGRVITTSLFNQIAIKAQQINPALIIVDTVADAFAGNENDRMQTRQFIAHMRHLGMSANAGMLLISHPSASGKERDDGMSGSTAWHNSCRARIYFKSVGKEDDGLSKREIRFLKSNYSREARTIRVRWQNGVFVKEPSIGSLEARAAEQRADDLFMALLRDFTAQGRSVTAKNGTSYAPAMFERSPKAKEAGITKKGLAASMERLLAANKIKMVEDGPLSRRRSRLIEIGADAST
jgi:RecA-family ATPase